MAGGPLKDVLRRGGRLYLSRAMSDITVSGRVSVSPCLCVFCSIASEKVWKKEDVFTPAGGFWLLR